MDCPESPGHLRLVAQGFGLSWALAGLVVVPVAVLLIPGRG